MSTEEEIKQRYKRIGGELTERTRRLFAANEALSLGWGGISAVSRATGLSRQVMGSKNCRGETKRKRDESVEKEADARAM